ncbi:MAG: NAD(P)-dependent oxidoreductase [Verrucomicrobiota bacterium]|jgi:3-hydroxyisobutyrate dehydrogenase
MNSKNTKPRVAFMGLGIMGSGMARRLLAAGFPLAVFNRDPSKSAPFAAEGARVAPTPRDAATGASIIISMVADDAASRALWLGENGALAAASPGAVIIECSTVTVACVHELSAAATARGCEMLDAPVTGSKPQAASGELTFLVGGAEAALEKARSLLSVMGRSIVHVGPVGGGALLKLINNFLCGVQTASLAEGLALIERSGLDRARALEVLATGAPGSPAVKNFSARMAARDYTPLFRLRLMAKDLRYACQEAARREMELVTAAAALRLFDKSLAAGDGDKDVSSLVEQFRSNRKT